MTQRFRRLWATGLCLGLLAAGCSHAHHHRVASTTVMQPTASAPVPSETVVITDETPAPKTDAPAAVVSSTTAGTTVHAPVTAGGSPTAPAEVEPAFHETRAEVASAPVPTVAAPLPQTPASTPDASVVQQAAYAMKTTMDIHEDSVHRRSYADITASSCYAHAGDYSWLRGELQLIHPRNVWRLRYASVDEEDRYGGSVTLTEAGVMAGFASGQQVRVEGCLVDPSSREPSPAYRVRSIQPLNPH